MANKNTGGPAFPIQNAYSMSTEQGMTLRDYFAARAMSGLLERLRQTQYIPHEQLANDAYMIADAMMKARNENS